MQTRDFLRRCCWFLRATFLRLLQTNRNNNSKYVFSAFNFKIHWLADWLVGWLAARNGFSGARKIAADHWTWSCKFGKKTTNSRELALWSFRTRFGGRWIAPGLKTSARISCNCTFCCTFSTSSICAFCGAKLSLKFVLLIWKGLVNILHFADVPQRSDKTTKRRKVENLNCFILINSNR